jgi:hypothetical protein
MGWIEREDCLAKEIEFRSNTFEGLNFEVDATDQHHSYSVFWTLRVDVVDKSGKEVPNAKVQIVDRNGEEVLTRTTGKTGIIEVELPEYTVDGDQVAFDSPYTVVVRKKKHHVTLANNSEIKITTK